MARGFDWNKATWKQRVRDQGDEYHKIKDKKKQFFIIKINGKRWDKKFESRLAALKAAQTIRHRYNHSTEVVVTK